MESQPGEGSPAPSEASGAEPLPTRIPWVRIVAVVLAVILVVTALALLNRHPNRAPTMTQVSAKPVAPEAGAEVTFTVQAADPDGDDLSYSWDLGDGTTGTGDLPPHVRGSSSCSWPSRTGKEGWPRMRRISPAST